MQYCCHILSSCDFGMKACTLALRMANKPLTSANDVYNELKSGNERWYKELENLFISINASDVLTSHGPVVNYKDFYTYAENLLMVYHCHQWSLT